MRSGSGRTANAQHDVLAGDRILIDLDVRLDMQVLDGRNLLLEVSELVEVRGEEREGFDIRRDVPVRRVRTVGRMDRTHSLMAQARPKPSLVEVPRPSSSMMMSESEVADCSRISHARHSEADAP